MATVFSDVLTVVNGPQYGQPPVTRMKVNRAHGRIRYLEATYTVPAGGVAIGDKIAFGKLPVASRVLGHLSELAWSAGAASSTLALGDNVNAARHLAATSVTAAGTATPRAAMANGAATFEATVDKNSVGNNYGDATDTCTLMGTVAGAALQAGQVITLRLAYTHD